MGDIEYFLGTVFTILHHFDRHLPVPVSQSTFTKFTACRFGVDSMEKLQT